MKGLGLAPLLFRPSPFYGVPLFSAFPEEPFPSHQGLPFVDTQYTPHYPARSPLESVLRLVAPGSDEYVEEKYAAEIGAILERWEESLKTANYGGLSGILDPAIEYTSFTPVRTTKLRSGGVVESFRHEYPSALKRGALDYLRELQDWIGRKAQVETAGFEITALEEIAAEPLQVRLAIRYNIVAGNEAGGREQRSGSWLTEWLHEEPAGKSETWKLRRLQAEAEMLSVANGPVFIDVTEHSLGRMDSYRAQMLHGSDHWRHSARRRLRHRCLRQQRHCRRRLRQ